MRLTSAGYGRRPAPGLGGRSVDWWLTDGEGIVACWLLVFAVCNGLRGVYCWFRDGEQRRTVGELLAGDLHPVRASFLLGGTAEAAETAVCVLVDDGVVKVSSTGGLRPTHRGRKQTDRALRALAEEIRGTPAGATTKLYEIADGARFTRFRELVERESPAVRPTASGRSQTLMLVTSMVTAFGMGLHAGPTNAAVPFAPGADRSLWLAVCVAAWLAQWTLASLWPSEKRRRWRALDAYCRDETEIARAALPDRTRQAIALTRERPKPPPAPRARDHTRDRGGAWADSGGADSCGGGVDSCGGCGGGCGGD
ncbi:hypothetical protein [Streptomyces sp. NPDC058751]|uniref:hypothetical protein n=1 Tax=Streptomyces sp. NPDC058751 TaxID=3346623 RepID=UPI0036CBB2C0